MALIFDVQEKENNKEFLGKILVSADEKNRDAYFSIMFDYLKNRARQNVILEFGYFIGKLSRQKVCCLYKGNIELPSDMHGLCYLHFNNSVSEIKDAIIEELKAAAIIS